MLKRIGLGWLVVAAVAALLASAGGAGARTDGAARIARPGPGPVNFSPTAPTAAALGFGSSLRVRGQASPSQFSNVTHGGPNHNGPVMASTKVYAIFWVPPGKTLSTAYQNAVTKYFQDVAAQSGTTGNVYGILPEYSIPGTTVKYAVTFGGSVVATDPIPSDAGCVSTYADDGNNPPSGITGLVGCVTESQEMTEVTSVLNAQGWTNGLTKMFFLFTPQQVGTCTDDYQYCSVGSGDSGGGYCGYHDYIGNAGSSNVTIWANMPYPLLNGVPSFFCDSGDHPNNDAVDATLSVVSHEHKEATTDPELNAWWDGNTGEEISDKCAWLFGNVLGNTGSGDFNQIIGTGRYHLQQDWDRLKNGGQGGCVLHGSQPALSVTSTTPVGGAPLGTLVTINGKGLLDTTSVELNGNPVTYNVTSPTAIQFTVPGDAVTGTLTVRDLAGAAHSIPFKITPGITTLSDDSGIANDPITINGTTFTASPVVKYGGVVDSTATVNGAGTQITSHVPPLAAAGPITVTTTGGTATKAFAILPTISSLSTTSGVAGDTITVNGTSLIGATKVTFGSPTAAGTIKTKAATALTVTVPATGSTGPVTVTNSGGSADSVDTFHITPKITSFTPTSGVAGTAVTINGTNMSPASSVTFNGVPATVDSNTGAKIVARVPPTATTGQISVTADGTALSSATTLFKPLPKLDTHAAVQAGDAVTVTGSNLTPTTALTFDGASLAGTIFSTHVDTTIPSTGVTGPFKITTPTGSSTITLGVRPTVTDRSPAQGLAGSTVTITGNTLGAVTKVTFGSPTATGTIKTKSATQLTVTVPTTGVTGPITVTNSGGSTNSASFTVMPKLSSISPTSGLANAQVTINGSGLANTSSVTFFNGAAASIFSKSATKVVALVPSDATVGALAVVTSDGIPTQLATVFKPLPKLDAPAAVQAGDALHLTGTNLSGVSTLTLGTTSFTIDGSSDATHLNTTDVVPDLAVTGSLKATTPGGSSTVTLPIRPTVSNVSPDNGLSGATITITGKTLGAVTKVTFGSTTATGTIKTKSAGTVTVTIPSSAVSGTVTVTNSSGSTPWGGTFNVLPHISSFSPASGAVGTKVKIKGTGLSASPTVSFNGTDSISLTLITPTEVDAIVPAGATTGKIHVHTSPGGDTDSATDYTVPGFAPPAAAAYSAGSPRASHPG